MSIIGVISVGPPIEADSSKEYTVILTKEEINSIAESLRMHGDLYSGHATRTEWCKGKYELALKLRKTVK